MACIPSVPEDTGKVTAREVEAIARHFRTALGRASAHTSEVPMSVYQHYRYGSVAACRR